MPLSLQRSVSKGIQSKTIFDTLHQTVLQAEDFVRMSPLLFRYRSKRLVSPYSSANTVLETKETHPEIESILRFATFLWKAPGTLPCPKVAVTLASLKSGLVLTNARHNPHISDMVDQPL